MQDFLWSLIAFIIAIGVLVTIHEFGHFWVAKRLKVKVLKFSIGFGKALWSKTSKSGTEYVIAAIPLGGYVKMLDESEGPVSEADKNMAFNRKPVWARMLVVLAGPFANFIFAIFAYWLMFLIGINVIAPVLGQLEPHTIAAQAGLQKGDTIVAVNGRKVNDWRDINLAMLPKLGEKGKVSLSYKPANTTGIQKTQLNLAQWKVNQSQPNILQSLGFAAYLPPIPTVISNVLPGSPAAKAGLQPKDQIIAIAKHPIHSWMQMGEVIAQYGNKPINITVLRQGKKQQLSITPVLKKTATGEMRPTIGIESESVKLPESMLSRVHYSFLEAGWHAVKNTWRFSALTLQMLYKMIIGQVSVKSISGPIGIAQGAGYSAQQGFAIYLSFLALISISLGIINLLPVPMLDGGHFLYYVIEVFRGKPLSIEAQNFGFRIGLILLAGLMLLAIFNDLSRLF